MGPLLKPLSPLTYAIKSCPTGSTKHCMNSVKIRSFFWSVFSPKAGKSGPEKTPHLDTFYAVKVMGCIGLLE